MTTHWNATEAMRRLDTDPTASPADVYPVLSVLQMPLEIQHLEAGGA